ncbi:MAG: ABC transporter substrate-binding protein [Clostridiales Family XIII bacterium]|jgi:NitT/TauT family transport system substrate-binding protein|nr:ABC transporter substrate-binding protein [Clostridiales Family XIII bacterium]
MGKKSHVLLSLLLALALAFSFAACGNSSNSSAAGSGGTTAGGDAVAAADDTTLDRVLQIGIYANPCEAHFFAADLLGLFEEAGYTVEWTQVADGTAQEYLTTGKIDITDGVLDGWLKPIEQGLDVRFTEALNQGCMATATLADTPIDSVEELVGKTIGVLGPIGGGVMDYLVRLIVEHGLDVDNDFEWVSFGDPAALSLALDNGDIDALVTVDSLVWDRVTAGEYKFVTQLSYDPETIAETCCLLMISPQLVDEHPGVAKKLTEILYQGALYAQDNIEEVIRYAQLKELIAGDVETNIDIARSYTFAPGVDLGLLSFTNAFKAYQVAGLIDADVDLDAIIDRTFVRYEGIGE